MVDLPGRPAYEPHGRADLPDDAGTEAVADSGWGSPVPAEYGSLYALQPPERTVEVPSPAVALHSAWSRVVGTRVTVDSAPARPQPTKPDSDDALETSMLTAVIPDAAPVPVREAPSPASEPQPVDPQPVDPQPVDSQPAEAQVADPAPVEPAPPVRSAPTLRPARRPGRARSRVVVRHVDVVTVARVSIVFYLIVLIVIVVAAVLLWIAADVFGTLPSLDKSVRTLFSLKKFHLHVGAVALFMAAAGVVIAVIGTLGNILLALVYNLITDVVGGVRVELESFGRDRSVDRTED